MKEVRHKGPHDVWFHLYTMSRIGKLIEAEYTNGYQRERRIENSWQSECACFRGDGNVLELNSGDGSTTL